MSYGTTGLTALTDVAGHTTTYVYTGDNLTETTDPSGHFGLSGFSFSGLLSTMQSAARYSTIAVNTLDKVDTVITLIQMTRGADQAFDAVRREVKSQSNGSNNLNSFIDALNNSDEAAMTLAANTGWLIGQMAKPELESKIKEFIKNPKNKLLIYAPTPDAQGPWLPSGTRIKIGNIGLSKGSRDIEIELGKASSQGGRMVGVGHSFANQRNQGKQWWRMDWHPPHGIHSNDKIDGNYHFHTLTAPR